MTTPTTINLVKCSDGSYGVNLNPDPFGSPNLYVVRKQTEDEVYDPYREERVKGITTKYGRKLPPAPKPSGWVVRCPLEELGWASTLDKAKDLIYRHAHGFWFSRCELFAQEIDRLNVTPDAVLNAITRFGLTYSDFVELDERPGQFHINGHSYSQAGSFWHRNLRVTRNTRRELFDRLAK